MSRRPGRSGPTCECGHPELNHLKEGGYRRCRAPACGCPHFVARKVCRPCGGYGIRFDGVPTRLHDALRGGVILCEIGAGRAVLGTHTIKVDLVHPGIKAVHRLESWLRKPEMEPEVDHEGLIEEFLDAGGWVCPWCYGHGQRFG